MEFVGQILKKNREFKNLTLKDISKELNISEDILDNIENNCINKNIDLVFFIGHLRSYCSYLGINHSELIEKFKKENFFNQSSNFEIKKPKIENSFFYLSKIFSFSLIFIIFLTFYLLFIQNDESPRDYAIIPELPENYEFIVEEASLEYLKKTNIDNKKEYFEELDNNLSSSSAIASSSKIQSDDSSIVTLKILDPTWLQLRNSNNEIILSQLMNKNDEFSYNLNLNYSITSGNAGHILVLINQKVRGKIGKKGQVVDSLVLDISFNN